MTLRLTDTEARALRRRADHEGRPMQEVARQAIREYIENQRWDEDVEGFKITAPTEP